LALIVVNPVLKSYTVTRNLSKIIAVNDSIVTVHESTIMWPPMLQGNPRAPGTYLWGHNAISDESPALVEKSVLHPVEYKSRDLPKKNIKFLKNCLSSLLVFYGLSSCAVFRPACVHFQPGDCTVKWVLRIKEQDKPLRLKLVRETHFWKSLQQKT
jgi:hypothetical protein